MLAQKGAGYVVNARGDTVKGVFKKPQFADMHEVKFRPEGSEEYRVFNGTQLRAFTIGKYFYETKRKSDLPPASHKDISYKIDSLIVLRRLLRGPMKLYVYADCYSLESNNAVRDYQRRNVKRCVQLYYMQRGDEMVVYGYRRVKGLELSMIGKKPMNELQMAEYFKDYESLSEKIKFGLLPTRKLVTIVKTYNEWKRAQPAEEVAEETAE